MQKIIVQFNSDNATEERYNQVWENLKRAGHETPRGLLYHIASHNGDKLSVTDIWESEEAFTNFNTILFPFMQESGITGQPPTVMPIYYEYDGRQ